jgi:hypothetical protein
LAEPLVHIVHIQVNKPPTFHRDIGPVLLREEHVGLQLARSEWLVVPVGWNAGFHGVQRPEKSESDDKKTILNAICNRHLPSGST